MIIKLNRFQDGEHTTDRCSARDERLSSLIGVSNVTHCCQLALEKATYTKKKYRSLTHLLSDSSSRDDYVKHKKKRE